MCKSTKKLILFVNIKKINIDIYNTFFILLYFFLILMIVVMRIVIVTNKTVQHDKSNKDFAFKYGFSITLLTKEMPEKIGR